MRSQGQWSPGSRPREAEPATARVIHQSHGREQRREKHTEKGNVSKRAPRGRARNASRSWESGAKGSYEEGDSGAGESYG